MAYPPIDTNVTSSPQQDAYISNISVAMDEHTKILKEMTQELRTLRQALIFFICNNSTATPSDFDPEM